MPATEHFFRNQKKLHSVFALSCVALLVSVIAMMVEDYADPWRGYQSTNFRLQAAARERDIEQMTSSADFEEQRSALQARRRENEKALKAYEDLLEEVDDAKDKAVRLVEALELELKSQNANRDEARADYDLAIRDGLPDSVLAVRKEGYEKAQAVCDEIQLQLEEAQKQLRLVGTPESSDDPEKSQRLAELAELRQEATEISRQTDKLEADVVLAQNALTKIKPDAWYMKAKRWMMELPIIEGFNGHLKVTQDWLPDLHQTLGMTSIARFDRCRTCHMNVDRTAPGSLPAFPHGQPSDLTDVDTWVSENKFPHPYATHPNHELFVTAASPHPVATFGCTACHDGQGSGVDFGNAEHSPNDPFQAEQWHHEYGYHPNHFWEYPMQPERFQESTCIKCHHSVVELGVHPQFGASAPKVVKGYNLIRKYGCFGCHEIHGFDGGEAIGPDMRLEPQTVAQKQRVVEDPTQIAGKFRKVGPSLRHIAAKTTAEFVSYWTEIPSRFRPSTKMPQFFDLTSHIPDAENDASAVYEPVELAGIAQVLIGDSQPIDLLTPADDYTPDVERGKQMFTERGCLACHEHAAVPGSKADFGPNISDIHRKVNRNADDASFSDWLYTWIKEPTRYHERTRMPDLYLDPYVQGEETIDPAADIVSFLLSQGEAQQFPQLETSDTALEELATLYLKKARFSDAAVKNILETKTFPQQAADVAGDERALATEDGSAVADPGVWKNRLLEYVGRRTIARYGCYGCHDIPGYEDARPIGVALQDWGRKDTSKLGLEHIEEFLHHHGEPGGASTRDRVKEALAMAEDGTVPQEELKPELTQAYFYDSLLHHGRPGFFWQKLRDPRSYDYMKTETKGYDERLRMPKFPLKEDEVEAMATFVLGLVAEPPAEKYIYTPDVREQNRIEGEFLLAKYNCTGCHIVELPKVTFGVDLEEDVYPTQLTGADHEEALELLLKLRKPKKALTGATGKFTIDGEEVDLPLASFHGIRMVEPDPEEEDPEFRESGFDTWETLDFGEEDDQQRVLPSSRITIPDSKMVEYQPARGGSFADWLVRELVKTRTGGNINLAWQASPPPLYQEGEKVQTPWLYQFLLEPEQLRYTTVLRMPKFNMDPHEAQTLANYFAAVDGAPFPYQELDLKEQNYLAQKQVSLKQQDLLAADEQYLPECWRVINGPLCIKCHSVGGRQFKVSDPKKDIQGPNLNRVQNRLRADWLRLWLYKPTWITPYTSMPVNFPKNQNQFPDLFGGEAGAQVEGVAAGLMNYTHLLEDVGPTVYTPPGGDAAAPAGADAGAEE
ncbi:MAG: c-type cytochrome [Fuerstiella sp.]